MKKLFLALLMVAFASCTPNGEQDDERNKNSSEKLVKSILNEYTDVAGDDHSSLVEIEYDDLQRPIEVRESYSEGGADYCSVSYGENSITTYYPAYHLSETYTFDDDGYLIGYGDITLEYSNGHVSKEINTPSSQYSSEYETIFTWLNGDMTEMIYTESGEKPRTTTYAYSDIDNKMNVGCFFPDLNFGWYMNKMKGISSKHYPVTENFEGVITHYEYTFDSDGYPTKVIERDPDNKVNKIQTISYY